MNTKKNSYRRAIPMICRATLACLLVGARVSAQTDAADADKAWSVFEKASQRPTPPEAWRTKRPTPEEIAKFRVLLGEHAVKSADQAKDFYTRFPKDTHAAKAREREFELLSSAMQFGNTNRLARLQVLEAERLKNPNLSEEERFKIRLKSVQTKANSRETEGTAAVVAEYEKGVRSLQQEFPKRTEVYQMLLELADASTAFGGGNARAMAQEVADSPAAPPTVKEAAKLLLKKLNLVGKPVPIKFTSVDGREIDLAKLRGKVVLIDFWATWCGPCVAELPNVKAAYEKLSPKGFEIIGLSFDENKTALTQFIAKEKLAWPQYFDGKGWQNKFAVEFGINSIPAMWLIDKNGNLRDLNGREDLTKKVEKLLDEK